MPRAKKAAAPAVEPPIDPSLRWLLVVEAAQYLRLSPQTVRQAIHSGELKAIRIGKGFHLDRTDLDRMMISRKKTIPPYRRGTRPWVAKRHTQNRKRAVA